MNIVQQAKSRIYKNQLLKLLVIARIGEKQGIKNDPGELVTEVCFHTHSGRFHITPGHFPGKR